MDLVKTILDTVAFNQQSEKRNYIGASVIGKPCKRAIWYDYNNVQGKEVSSQLQITFDIGKSLEGLLLQYIEMSGLKVERATQENNYLFLQADGVPELQGHPDAILHLTDSNPCILEIKTANSSSFNKFKKDGLLVWSQSYYTQLMAYMGMSGCHDGVLLAVNKDTSEMHHEWIHFSQEEYDSILNRVREIVDAEREPERINSSPMFYICNMCSYKNYCHSQRD